MFSIFPSLYRLYSTVQYSTVCLFVSHLRSMGLNVLLYGHTYIKSMDEPGKVANPARGQLNRENKYYRLPIPLFFVPSPSETWFRGMSVGGSFRRVQGRAHPREMQPTGCLRVSVCRLRRSGGMVG